MRGPPRRRGIRRTTSPGWLPAIGVALMLVLAGCVAGPTAGPTETPTASATETLTPPPALESVLWQLYSADDRSTFAADHGLSVRNGSVLVVVQLAPNASMPATPDSDIRAMQGQQVQAFVAIDDLVSLAIHANVTYVRSPQRASSHGKVPQQ